MRLSRFFRHRKESDPLASSDIQSVSRSHVGRFRTLNEDRILDRPNSRLWAIADGMGGHVNGSLAAETVIAHLGGLPQIQEPAAIRAAIEAANGSILEQAGGKSGTTIVALKIFDDCARIWWAGDSRAYRLRDGKVDLLTRDHSLVQELVEVGEIAADEAAGHPRANVITRALGIASSIDLDVREIEVRAGDLLLLCSDGLSRSFVSDDLRNEEPIDAMADRLLRNALERDGRDNISFVLVKA